MCPRKKNTGLRSGNNRFTIVNMVTVTQFCLQFLIPTLSIPGVGDGVLVLINTRGTSGGHNYYFYYFIFIFYIYLFIIYII